MFAKTLLILLSLLLLLLYLYSRQKAAEGDASRPKAPRKKYPRWKGPKTDERINRMLAESIALMKELGVPISDSISPEVKLTSAHAYLGCCCPKGSLKDCTEYDYYIRIPGFTINNTEKSLRNTLIHELIHTVPGGLCHTGEWKNGRNTSVKRQNITFSATMETKPRRTRRNSVAADMTNKL